MAVARAVDRSASAFLGRFLPVATLSGGMLVEALIRATPKESTLELRTLYEEHLEFVWATLLRLGVHYDDAEDVTHEVFLIVHRRLDAFEERAHVRTWLYGICRRVMSNYRRRMRTRRGLAASTSSFEDVAETERAGDETNPEERAQEREARDLILAALDRMPLHYRDMFVMFEIDEMPCKDIADELGVAKGTVHSRLHRARELFRAAVESVRAEAALVRERRGEER